MAEAGAGERRPDGHSGDTRKSPPEAVLNEGSHFSARRAPSPGGEDVLLLAFHFEALLTWVASRKTTEGAPLMETFEKILDDYLFFSRSTRLWRQNPLLLLSFAERQIGWNYIATGFRGVFRLCERLEAGLLQACGERPPLPSAGLVSITLSHPITETANPQEDPILRLPLILARSAKAGETFSTENTARLFERRAPLDWVHRKTDSAQDTRVLDKSSFRIGSYVFRQQEHILAPGIGAPIQVFSVVMEVETQVREQPLRSFGPYELIEEVGRGGMGIVYRARHIELGRIVAIKLLILGEISDDRQIRRFLAEARMLASLSHPGIVPIYDIGIIDGVHYFTMPYLPGSSLGMLLKDLTALPPPPPEILDDQEETRAGSEKKNAALASGSTLDSGVDLRKATAIPQHVRGHMPLPVARVLKLMLGIADALQYAHEHGIVHRDMKPSNVLITLDGEPVLLDFGLARQMDERHEFSYTGQVMGSAHYMAPEQAMGLNDEVDEQSDLFSLGSVFFELLTGQKAFPGQTQVQIMEGVVNRDPPRPQSLAPEVPQDLETICLMVLEKEKERRYRSAAALKADLLAFRDGRPIRARRVSLIYKVRRWIQRHRRTVWPLLLICFVSLSVFFYLRSELQVAREEVAVERAKTVGQWELVFDDTFSGTLRQEAWIPIGGQWSVLDGQLEFKGAGEGFLFLALPVAGNLRLEFQACAVADEPLLPPQNIGCLIGGDPNAPCKTGYWLRFFGEGNLHTVSRNGELLAVQKVEKQDSRAKHLYRLDFQEGRIVYSLDRNEPVTILDPAPLGGFGHVRVALSGSGSHLCFENMRLFRQRFPEQMSAICPGDALLAANRFAEAEDYYKMLLDLSKQTPLGREARYKQGLTLFRQAEMAGDFLREGSPALEELRQAQKIFKELATVSLDPMLASKNLLLAAQTDCLCNESSVLFSGLSELELRNRRCFDLMADPLLVRYFSRAPDRIPLIQAFRAEKFQATHRWLDGLLAWKRIETFSGTPAETARQLDLFLQEFETFPSLVALALERRAGLLSLEKEADRKGFSEWLLQLQAKAPGQILAEARMRALLVTALLEKGLLLEAEKCLEEMPGRSWLPARERGELENLNVRLLLCQNRREAAVARMRKWFEEGVPPVLAWPVEFATLSGEECEALSLAVAKKNLALRQMLTALSAGTEKKFRFRELLELCSRETAP